MSKVKQDLIEVVEFPTTSIERPLYRTFNNIREAWKYIDETYDERECKVIKPSIRVNGSYEY